MPSYDIDLVIDGWQHFTEMADSPEEAESQIVAHLGTAGVDPSTICCVHVEEIETSQKLNIVS